MKHYFKILSVLLLFLFTAHPLRAASPPEINIVVDFTDGTFTQLSGFVQTLVGDTGWINVSAGKSATSLVVGGNFTKVHPLGTVGGNVVIFISVAGVFTGTQVAAIDNLPDPAGLAANNVFLIEWNTGTSRFSISTLANSYSGGGNGTSGEVADALIPAGSTKVYLSGMFITAGGYSNGRHFAAYDFSGTSGWSQLQYFPMYCTGPSYTMPLLQDAGNGSVWVLNDGNVTAYVDQYSSKFPYAGHPNGLWSPTNKSFTQ